MNFQDITNEITTRTSRSGGSGGQNVNKVETKVELLWSPADSQLVTDAERAILLQKLKLNSDGFLQITAQEDRTQLKNKQNALRKLIDTIQKALVVPLKRKKTKMPEAVKAKIKRGKAINAVKKANRRRPDMDDE